MTSTILCRLPAITKKVAVLTKIGHDFYIANCSTVGIRYVAVLTKIGHDFYLTKTLKKSLMQLSQSSLKLDMTSTKVVKTEVNKAEVAVLTKIGHDFYCFV